MQLKQILSSDDAVLHRHHSPVHLWYIRNSCQIFWIDNRTSALQMDMNTASEISLMHSHTERDQSLSRSYCWPDKPPKLVTQGVTTRESNEGDATALSADRVGLDVSEDVGAPSMDFSPSHFMQRTRRIQEDGRDDSPGLAFTMLSPKLDGLFCLRASPHHQATPLCVSEAPRQSGMVLRSMYRVLGYGSCTTWIVD